MTSRGGKWLLALSSILVVLALMEAGCRLLEVWRPSRTLDLAQGFDANSRLFVPSAAQPGWMETNPLKCQTLQVFQAQRFALRKPAGCYRIFFVGESSVYQLQPFFPDYAAHLQTLLPAQWKTVEILNAGGCGYGSHRLVAVVAEILKYQPDCVAIYLGHNEFVETMQFRVLPLKTLGVQQKLRHSALFRVIQSAQVSRWEREMKQSVARTRQQGLSQEPPRDLIRTMSFTPKEVAERMDAFRGNLETMLALCRQTGVPVILGSVPSNLLNPWLPSDAEPQYRPVWQLVADGKFKEAAELGSRLLEQFPGRLQASAAENRILRSLAQQPGVWLADVEKAIVEAEPDGLPGEALFGDWCHLNRIGAAVFLEVYKRSLMQLWASGRASNPEFSVPPHVALGIKPPLALAHFGIARTLQAHGWNEQAFVHFRAAIEQGGVIPSRYAGAAAVLKSLGRVEESKEYARKALTLFERNPQWERERNRAEYCFGRAGVHELLGESDEAVKWYGLVIREDAENWPAHRKLAELLIEARKPREAAPHVAAVRRAYGDCEVVQDLEQRLKAVAAP